MTIKLFSLLHRNSFDSSHFLKLSLLFILSILFFGWSASAHSQSRTIFLDDMTPMVHAWPAVTILADPQKNLQLDEVIKSKDKFELPKTAYATLGMRPDAVWLHIPFSVSPESNGIWVFDAEYPVIN
ncbi:MAG: 7TM-DISM domain-containing protein, partial [Pseudomonadota bacterium]